MSLEYDISYHQHCRLTLPSGRSVILQGMAAEVVPFPALLKEKGLGADGRPLRGRDQNSPTSKA